MIALFDTIEDKNCKAWMDNLYLMTAFCKKGNNHPKREMLSGVAKEGIHGILECAKQEIVINGKNQIKVYGTVKAAVLKCNNKYP